MALQAHLRRLTVLFVPLILFASSPQGLRGRAESAGILVGTAVRPSLLSEAAYSATLSREFNLIEPEDAMKWWMLRPTGDKFEFGKADEIVRYAHAHGVKIRGHCLVWDHNNPDWIAQGHFTPAQDVSPVAGTYHDSDEALFMSSMKPSTRTAI